MPKRKRQDEDPKKQFERFVEAARTRNVDTTVSEEQFKKLSKKTSEDNGRRYAKAVKDTSED